MNNFLKRLLELSKKTGDRIVFADIDGEQAHVVLSLEDYEKLILGNATVSGTALREPKTEIPAYNAPAARGETSNALDEISREVVRTLEVESRDSSTNRKLSLNDDLDIEPEERYYLEPLE